MAESLFGGDRASSSPRALAAAGEGSAHEPGEVIVSEGDAAEHMFVLLRGTVTVCEPAGPDGVPHERVVKAPAVFGQMEAIADGAHRGTVTCEERAELWAIPSESFREHLDQSAVLAAGIARALAARLCVPAQRECRAQLRRAV
ncbi:MAG: cyclic nucleotide-binding domain-containing protein [Myxococcota bacterium]